MYFVKVLWKIFKHTNTPYILVLKKKISLQILLHKKDYSSVFILVDTNTETHCLPMFLAAYPCPENCEVISIEAGEEHKHIQTCTGVWEALSSLGAESKKLAYQFRWRSCDRPRGFCRLDL